MKLKNLLLVLGSSITFMILAPGASQAQVAASSSEANPYSANANSNTNTVYNVLPNGGTSYSSESNTNVLSLTLSLGWSNTYVYPAAPTTCPVAILPKDVYTTRIPLGCPVPAVVDPNQLNQTQNPNQRPPQK